VVELTTSPATEIESISVSSANVPFPVYGPAARAITTFWEVLKPEEVISKLPEIAGVLPRLTSTVEKMAGGGDENMLVGMEVESLPRGGSENLHLLRAIDLRGRCPRLAGRKAEPEIGSGCIVCNLNPKIAGARILNFHAAPSGVCQREDLACASGRNREIPLNQKRIGKLRGQWSGIGLDGRKGSPFDVLRCNHFGKQSGGNHFRAGIPIGNDSSGISQCLDCGDVHKKEKW
jgi:hypothetical protein